MKEPKEEAERIIEMFMNTEDECDCHEHRCVCFRMYDLKAKQLGVLHVNGIIESNPTTKEWDTMSDGTVEIWHVDNTEYYKEVKQILENK